MKKLVSLLCVLAVTVTILAIGVVSASADVPSTVLDVKSGDKVSYSLAVGGVPEKIVGCDFSVYYDSSAFNLDSVADFNDSTDDSDWQATINPDLNGEVRGNWSILKGVDFSSKRNIVTLNLTAKKDASAHISYFVRYMYDNTVFDSDDRPQIGQYTFSCDVTKNGQPVIENAQPELNVDEEQPNGLFINSRTGKSSDANTALSGDSIKENGGAVDDISVFDGNENVNISVEENAGDGAGNVSGGNNSGGNSGSASTAANNISTEKTDSQKGVISDQSVSENKKDSGNTTVDATDADGKLVENKSGETVAAAKNEGKSSSAMMWIIIAAVVVIAGGCIAYVVVKGKKGAPAKAEDKPAEPVSEDEE